MEQTSSIDWAAKTFYRPIEAAIRWCGLVILEKEILATVSDELPRPKRLSKWPRLALCLDRIFDAILNGELPYGNRGITLYTESPENDPELTIRHIDLRVWLLHFYPEEKPPFLFGLTQQLLHHRISMDVVRALIAERDMYSTLVEQQIKLHEQSKQEICALQTKLTALSPATVAPKSPDARAETTYLNIIGGLLSLLLERHGNARGTGKLSTQAAVIDALIEAHPHCAGLTERTLWTKFAAANRQLATSTVAA